MLDNMCWHYNTSRNVYMLVKDGLCIGYDKGEIVFTNPKKVISCKPSVFDIRRSWGISLAEFDQFMEKYFYEGPRPKPASKQRALDGSISLRQIGFTKQVHKVRDTKGRSF